MHLYGNGDFMRCSEQSEGSGDLNGRVAGRGDDARIGFQLEGNSCILIDL